MKLIVYKINNKKKINNKFMRQPIQTLLTIIYFKNKMGMFNLKKDQIYKEFKFKLIFQVFNNYKNINKIKILKKLIKWTLLYPIPTFPSPINNILYI